MKLPLLMIIIFVSSQSVHTQWGDTLTNNPVFTGPFTQFGPRGVTDGANGAIIFWVDAEDAYVTGIYAQRLEGTTGNRMFNSGGVEIFKDTLTGGERFADAVPDGDGGAFVIWGTRSTSVGFVYAQRISNNGNLLWSHPVPLTNGPRISSRPRIVADGFGGAIIVWAERDPALVSWVYAQRLNPSGEPQWGVDGLRICSSTIGHQFNPMLVEDGLGGVIVVWEDLRSLTYQDLYAQRINFSGIPQWSPAGMVVCANQMIALMRGVVSAGEAGAVVCWWDLTQGDHSVWIQGLNSQGEQLWNSSGVTVAGPGKVADPLIVSDGSGGSIISWIDSTNGYDHADIYAQRIDSLLGSPLWSAPVHIAEAGWQLGYYSLMAVENSGSIIVWSYIPDPSNLSEIDLYTQKLNGMGNIEWRLNGATVSKAPGIQINTALVSDGAGGAIAIWQDTRNPGNLADIYAQNFAALGLPTRLTKSITQTNNGYPFMAGSTIFLTANFEELGSVNEMTVDAYVNGRPPGLTKAVPRYFGLSVNGSGFNASLTFNYTDEEVAAAGLINGDANLQLYKNEGSGWEFVGGTVDPIANIINVSGVTSFSLWAMRDPTDTVTSVHNENQIPREYVLYQNYPNPFNPTTKIEYKIPNFGFVLLKVYDLLGREVATLFNEEKPAGNYEVNFDASGLSSGVYFYQLKATPVGGQAGNGFVETKKMVLLR